LVSSSWKGAFTVPFILLLVVFLLIVVFAVLFGAYSLYHLAFATPRERTDAPPEMDTQPPYGVYRTARQKDLDALVALPCERVSVTASDGTPLAGRFYQNPTAEPGAPVALFFHGWHGHALRDGSGLFWICRDLGYHMLMVDQRALGLSGGKCMTMGVKERYDCLVWANWAADRFGLETPLFVMGVSMGAATVLMASDLALPKSVKGIVADCGFTSPTEILRKCIPDYHLPVWPAYPIGVLGARLFGRFDPAAADARVSLAHTDIPVLFIHGEADDFVPCQMSRDNYAACRSEKTLVTIPGAPHAVAYYQDPALYRAAVTEFCQKRLQS